MINSSDCELTPSVHENHCELRPKWRKTQTKANEQIEWMVVLERMNGSRISGRNTKKKKRKNTEKHKIKAYLGFAETELRKSINAVFRVQNIRSKHGIEMKKKSHLSPVGCQIFIDTSRRVCISAIH